MVKLSVIHFEICAERKKNEEEEIEKEEKDGRVHYMFSIFHMDLF